MRIGESAARRVHRQLAAGRGVPLPDEVRAFASLTEPKVLETPDREMRKGVVDHQVIDIGMFDARLLESLCGRDAEGAGAGVALKLAHHAGLHTLAGAEDVDRVGREILGTFRFGDDQGAAAVGDEAAHQQGEGPGDHPGVHHVVDGNRILEHGARVLTGPFPLDRRHIGDLFDRHTVLIAVAEHR